MPRIVMISDTHGLHSNVYLPPGDILIHAGDLTNVGRPNEIIEVCGWLNSQTQFRHIVCVGGNHDWVLETVMKNKREKDIKKLFGSTHYLRDNSVVLDGLRIYGSPFSPEFCSWAFNLPRGKALADKWKKIPKKVDVLVTHSPPAGILDKTMEGDVTGCADLLKAVEARKPKVHVFGHIHEAWGKVESNGTTFVNASICTRQYKPTNPAMVVDI